MLYHFPNKFKSEELATGGKYEIDEYEEYKTEALDEAQLAILEKQRARRKRVGRFTLMEREGDEFLYQVTRQNPDTGADEILSREKFHELLRQEE